MRFLSLLLCSALVTNPLWAQTSSANSPGPVSFHVHVVDDPGPVLSQTTSAKGYVVQVTNTNGEPVAGAAVALRLPEDGSTGRFSNGLRAWVAYSDTAGIARFPVITWGETPGAAAVRLTAAKGAIHSNLTVWQQISAEPRSMSLVQVPVAAAPVVATPAQASPGVLAAAPKPAPPTQPQLATQSATIVQPFADIVSPTTPMNKSRSGASPDTSVKPHKLTPNPPAPAKETTEPIVSITNSSTGASGAHQSHKKLYTLLAVAAGAGAAAGTLLAVKGHGGAPSSSTAGISLGSPTISLGH